MTFKHQLTDTWINMLFELPSNHHLFGFCCRHITSH
uniref:Uncharacterized protein n=1 Tax=Anguilla anguilla TaxID=7936 RepID=A0A0E9SQQ6_ANGAN